MIIESIWAIATVGVGSSAIAAWASYFINRPGNREMRRANKVRSTPALEASPAPISQEMRDEIEQNETWWLRSFHTLLLQSGAEVTNRIIGREDIEHWQGHARVRKGPDRIALKDCICGKCEGVRKDAEKMATEVIMHAPVDLSFNNTELVKEIQRAYGHAPDGLCGPALTNAMIHRRPNFQMMSLDAIRLMNAFLKFVVEQEQKKLALPGRAVDWDAEVAYWTALDRKKSRKYA